MPKLLEELKQKRAEIYEIASKYGVSNIRVFGSVARGEEKKNSDVDLLVKISKHKGMGFDLIRFERDLKAKLNKEVDTISENGVYHLLKEQIFNECVPL